jgi:hypothetical protein
MKAPTAIILPLPGVEALAPFSIDHLTRIVSSTPPIISESKVTEIGVNTPDGASIVNVRGIATNSFVLGTGVQAPLVGIPDGHDGAVFVGRGITPVHGAGSSNREDMVAFGGPMLISADGTRPTRAVTLIGPSIQARGTMERGILIGEDARGGTTDASIWGDGIGIGAGSRHNVGRGVNIGAQSSTGADETVNVGWRSQAGSGATQAVAIGDDTRTNAPASIVIGKAATDLDSTLTQRRAISLGKNAAPRPAAVQQIILGGVNADLHEEILIGSGQGGHQLPYAAPFAMRWAPMQGGVGNVDSPAAALEVDLPRGTGNAPGGPLQIFGALIVATGDAAQTRATFLRLENGVPNLSLWTAAPNYQGGEQVVYLPDAVTIPGANPASGAFLYIDPADGGLKARTAAGITVLAP